MKETTRERFFSVELKSKVSLKSVTFTSGSPENVLVEGTIGELRCAEFADDAVLVVNGDKGVLRINLAESEIKKEQEGKKEA